MSCIDSIMEKLVQGGIVQERGQVDGSVLEEAVLKYFGRRASKRLRDEEEVEIMLRRAYIGEGNGVAGPSGDMRGAPGGDGGGQGGTGTGHGEAEPQLAADGDGGQGQGKERKRRRVSRTRGE